MIIDTGTSTGGIGSIIKGHLSTLVAVHANATPGSALQTVKDLRADLASGKLTGNGDGNDTSAGVGIATDHHA